MVLMVTLKRECVEMTFRERAVFLSAVSKKMCDFHSRPDFKAVKLTFGQKKPFDEVNLCS